MNSHERLDFAVARAHLQLLHLVLGDPNSLVFTTAGPSQQLWPIRTCGHKQNSAPTRLPDESTQAELLTCRAVIQETEESQEAEAHQSLHVSSTAQRFCWDGGSGSVGLLRPAGFISSCQVQNILIPPQRGSPKAAAFLPLPALRGKVRF